MLRREHDVKREASPTGTYKQTNQKDQTVFMDKYQTPVFEQMDMKQAVFTVEYSSDHSGCYTKRQTKHEQTYYYTDHQQLVSSKQSSRSTPGIFANHRNVTRTILNLCN